MSMDSHDRASKKKRSPRAATIAVRLEGGALVELDAYVADRKNDLGDARFGRATAIRELVLIGLGLHPEKKGS